MLELVSSLFLTIKKARTNTLYFLWNLLVAPFVLKCSFLGLIYHTFGLICPTLSPICPTFTCFVLLSAPPSPQPHKNVQNWPGWWSSLLDRSIHKTWKKYVWPPISVFNFGEEKKCKLKIVCRNTKSLFLKCPEEFLGQDRLDRTGGQTAQYTLVCTNFTSETLPQDRQLNILHCAQISPLETLVRTNSLIFSSVHKSYLQDYLRTEAQYPTVCTNLTSDILPEDIQLNILPCAQILPLRLPKDRQLNILQCAQISHLIT